MSTLEICNLSVAYNSRVLISGLSFQLNGPAFIAIVGHNGCGKSSFLRSLAGQQAYSGEILFDGNNLSSLLLNEKAKRLTLLEQKNTINFSIKVIDLVLMGRFRLKKLFQNYSDADVEIVNQTLQRLSIQHLAEKDFLEISGGEQQLVWLAQIIVQDTELVLLDEPSQQLDVYNRKKLFDLMQYLSYDLNKIVFCITHDIANLIPLKGYILNLSRKKVQLELISEKKVMEELQFLENKKS